MKLPRLNKFQTGLLAALIPVAVLGTLWALGAWFFAQPLLTQLVIVKYYCISFAVLVGCLWAYFVWRTIHLKLITLFRGY